MYRPLRHLDPLVVASCAALLCATWACADDAGVLPSADTGGFDAGTDAASDLGGPDDLDDEDTGGVSSITLQSSGLSVRVEFAPFSFEVKDPTGRVVLRSAPLPVEPSLGGPAGAYGPPAIAERPAMWDEERWVGWDGYVASSSPWARFDRTLASETTPGSVRVVLGASGGTETLEVGLAVEDNRLIVSLAADGAASHAWLGQTFALGEDERFFGLGGRVGPLDRRGASFRGWVEANGEGRGEGEGIGTDNPAPNGADMTGTPIPFLLSSAGYGLWLETDDRWAVHLGSEDEAHWRFEVAAPELRYTVFVNSDPLKTLTEYTAMVGRPPLPPEWVFGPRRYTTADATVFDMPEHLALREFGVATTTLEDERSALLGAGSVRRSAGVDELVRELGYRRLARLAPLLPSTDDELAGLYARAETQGYLLLDEAGDPYLVAGSADGAATYGLLDPSAPRAMSWFANQLDDVFGAPVDAWRLEGLALVPHDAVLASGLSGAEAHNAYPVAIQEALVASLGTAQDEAAPVLVSDAGYTGSASLLTMVWSGPLNTSFEAADGLLAAVRAGIGLGLSGFPFYGTDVGGNDATTSAALDRELLLRWSAFAAFAPGMASGGALASSDWTIWSDSATLATFAEHALLHTRLAPYLHGLAAQAVERGAPLMRHPFLQFPSDPLALAVDDAYFLGRRLYVAPVVERGATARSVYLPAGIYVDWASGEVLAGGQTIVADAPLGTIPVFLADGAIVPMYDASIDTLAPSVREDVVDPADVGDVLDVRAAVSAGTTSFTLADGTLLTLERGGPASAPYLAGAAEPLPLAQSAEDLASCDGCYTLTSAAPVVLRLTTPLAEVSRVEAGGLVVSVTNPAGQPRRVRWHIDLPEPVSAPE